MSKENMIAAIEEMLHTMYYEDLLFFHGMMSKFLKKTAKK